MTDFEKRSRRTWPAGVPRICRRRRAAARRRSTPALKAGLEFLRESRSATPAMRDRIARTLEAISAYGRTSPEEARGRLSADLNPPGFEALAALAGAVQGAPALRLVKPATVRETGEAPRRKETGRAATPSREKPKPKSNRAQTERDREREARHAAALKDARSRQTREEAALRLRTGEAGSAAKRSDEAARDERDALAALERARREVAEAEREAQKARTARKAAEVQARQSAAALEKAERTGSVRARRGGKTGADPIEPRARRGLLGVAHAGRADTCCARAAHLTAGHQVQDNPLSRPASRCLEASHLIVRTPSRRHAAWPAAFALSICASTPPGRETTTFRCVFLKADTSTPLLAAHRRSREAFGVRSARRFFPHLSLIYGRLDGEEKREITGNAIQPFVFRVSRVHLWVTQVPGSYLRGAG